MLVLLNVVGHFVGVFLDSWLSLVLVLLEYFLLAFGGVAVNGGVDPQLFLVECHDVVVVRNVLLQEGVLLHFALLSLPHKPHVWVDKLPALRGVGCVLVEFAGESARALLRLEFAEFSKVLVKPGLQFLEGIAVAKVGAGGGNFDVGLVGV